MTRRTRMLAFVFVPLLAMSACGDDSDADDATEATTETETTAQAAAVTVSGAWARTSPMMATNGAVYMELTADVEDRLVGARVDPTVAAAAEVHETVMDPDSQEMAMRETPAIELPAGESVVLEPGGYHVMLLDLTEPLEPGTTIDVVLEFDGADDQVVRAEVRDEADPMAGG